MKYLYFLTLLLTNILFAQNNNKTDTVDVVAYWNKGDVYKYEITESSYKYKRYDTISKDVKKYDLKITVLDSTANSYTLKWETKFKLPEDNPYFKKYIEKHLKNIANFTILYQTDEFGRFAKLINKKDVKKAYRKVFDLAFKNTNLGAHEKNMINQFIDNDEYFENYLLQDLNQYHQFYGNQLSKKSDIQELEIMNPFSNKPMLLKQIYRISDIDLEDETYTIKMDQLMDEEKVLNEILDNLNAKNTTPIDASVFISINQLSHFSGVILYSNYSKLVDVDGESLSIVKEFLLK